MTVWLHGCMTRLKIKDLTADRRRWTALKDQRQKKQEIQYANEYSDPDSRG
jgi:hypothetical protein